MDTVFILRLGALVLLALGSVLVLRVVAAADLADQRPRPLVQRKRRPSPEPQDPFRKAA
jgi:hypothetical protein